MFSVDIKEDFVKVGRVVRLYHKHEPGDQFLELLQNDYDEIEELVYKIMDNDLSFNLFGGTIRTLFKQGDYDTEGDRYLFIIYLASLIDNNGYDDLVKHGTLFTRLTEPEVRGLLLHLKENIDKLKEVNEHIRTSIKYRLIL